MATTSNKYKITLLAYAGLCNRMNTILSAIALRERNKDVDIDIYWSKGKECYARFSDLFQPIDQFKGITIHELHSFFLEKGKKSNLYLPTLARRFMFDAELFCREIRDNNIEDYMVKYPNLYIRSYNRFCKYIHNRSIAEIFIPKEDIQNVIDDVTSQFSDYTIGIHIRRTDHTFCIEHNPLGKFELQIDKEIALNDNVKFYVASDSPEEKQALISKYGDRIITHRWDLRRNSLQGIKDAVAELYCLGLTKKILGSFDSTYSEVASQLYNIPLFLVGKEK